MMKKVRAQLAFTDRLQEAVPDADIIFIAVGTPSRPDGRANTSYLEGAAEEVGGGNEEGWMYTVVVKSTVPIGGNRRVAHVIQQVLRAPEGQQGKGPGGLQHGVPQRSPGIA